MRLQSAIGITATASVVSGVREDGECHLESIVIRLEDLLEVDQLSQFGAPVNVPGLFLG